MQAEAVIYLSRKSLFFPSFSAFCCRKMRMKFASFFIIFFLLSSSSSLRMIALSWKVHKSLNLARSDSLSFVSNGNGTFGTDNFTSVWRCYRNPKFSVLIFSTDDFTFAFLLLFLRHFCFFTQNYYLAFCALFTSFCLFLSNSGFHQINL